MLSPLNEIPPYGVVHIYPESTLAMGSTAYIDKVSSHYQLARDKVRVTFYGVNNDQVLTFLDCVNQYSRDYDYIGLLNAPIIQDEKVTQAELNIIASKKCIDFEVSYNQISIRNIARQMIVTAPVTVTPIYPVIWPDPNPPQP
jgi:hypothetical protein